MNILKRNLDYIKAINTCDLKTCTEFFRTMIVEVEDPDKVKKLFVSKLYLWNILRGKQFYKTMSYFIISVFDDYNAIEEGVMIYEYIMSTISDEQTRKMFTSAVMKKHPFFTRTSIKYCSSEHMINVLLNDTWLYYEPDFAPFINALTVLKANN